MAKTSRLFLSETQEAYLAWLLTPDDSKAPTTKKAWAELHDVHINTLGLWEKNKIFKERWELGVKGLAQSPERTQALLDALYTKGVSGDVKSAELYLKATGFMQQVQTVNVNNVSSVKELSDEDLHSMILELSQKKQPTISITKVEEEGDSD